MVYDVAVHLGWRTVSIVIVDGNEYGKSLKAEFKRIVADRGQVHICELTDNR